MNRLKQWLQKRRMRHSKELYNRGFDYAIGALIRGDKTPLELDAEQFPGYRNIFDVGMDNAIDFAVQHKLVEDDMV